MRREIAVGLREDVLRTGGTPLWETTEPTRGGYVESAWSLNPYGCLLWRDVEEIERAARLSYWQVLTWDAYLSGELPTRIAERLRVHHSVITRRIDRIEEKALAVMEAGLITCVYETFGWQGVRELLADFPASRYKRGPARDMSH